MDLIPDTNTRLRQLALVAILTVAAGTRLVGLTEAPPGINHDEASNGYDAYSILQTGKDRWGEPWPVLLEAFGRADHRGALYAYLVVPFHAMVGKEHLILSTRLPAAVLGVLTIACLYLLVSKLASPATGLWAALLLTLSPWHLQLSRFGHESSLTPACTIFALTLMAYARWPFRGQADPTPSIRLNPPLLAAAGAVFALSLYSYPSMRLFTPALIIAGAFCYRRTIAAMIRESRSRNALIIMFISACLVATPLIWLAVNDWDGIAARARQLSVFHQSAGLLDVLIQCCKNYVAHFGYTWLITKGDPSIVQSPQEYGQLSVCIIPFLLAGIIILVKDRRRNRSYDFLLAWLLLYPIAATVTLDGPHALRSACGLPVFQWIAAIGCQWLVTRLGRTSRIRTGVAGACVLAVTVNAALCFKHYFFVWARDPRIVSMYQQDLCDALKAVRPMIKDYDRVHISDQRDRDRNWFSGEAYIIAALVLPVEPADFHGWPKSVFYERPADGFHRVDSFGPFVMTTRTDVLGQYFASNPQQSALIIARPGEIHGGTLVETITDATGTPTFEIIAVRP